MATEIIPPVMITLCLSFRNFPATPPAMREWPFLDRYRQSGRHQPAIPGT
jgi:hypothetical protein